MALNSIYHKIRALKYKPLADYFPSSTSSDDRYPPFPRFPPPSPEKILPNRRDYGRTISRRKYAVPIGEDDSPLYSLYRLYEQVILDNDRGIRKEIEYFWNQDTWIVSEIPDPKDEDPARYAVLACLTQMLVIAFNNHIGIGLPRDATAIMTSDEIEKFGYGEKEWETAPSWAAEVPPLKKTLRIPHKLDPFNERKGFKVLESMDHPGASSFFKEKNILILEPHFLLT